MGPRSYFPPVQELGVNFTFEHEVTDMGVPSVLQEGCVGKLMCPFCVKTPFFPQAYS